MAEISAAREDYLEAILTLSETRGYARSVEVAERLGVSRASVSRAIGKLKELGYVEAGRYASLTLTPAGVAAAQTVRDRHSALKAFLVNTLGVEEAIAEVDACRMEHCVSRETLERIKALTEHSR